MKLIAGIMKLKKTYPYAYLGSLVLMPVYLFIVVSHLFFVPKFQESSNYGVRPCFKKDALYFYYLVRNDRSTFNENKPVKTFAKNKSIFFISLLTNTNSLSIAQKHNTNVFRFSPNHHYSYLVNHILRI
jgi:hypothetical protein